MMQTFLEPIDSPAAKDPLMLQALALCHERFIQTMALELVQIKNGNTLSPVRVEEVESVMRSLGLDEILQEAKATTADSSRRKRYSVKPHRPKQKYTDEDLAEQEKLLASSLEQMQKEESSSNG